MLANRGDVGEVFGEGGVDLPCLTTSQYVVDWWGVLRHYYYVG